MKRNRDVKNQDDTGKFSDTNFINCTLFCIIRSELDSIATDCLLWQMQTLNVFLKSRCSKKISFPRGGQIRILSRITRNKFICMEFVETDHRVRNFLFSLYISFLSSFSTILFPTYLYKNVFSRKILSEKSLLYYKINTYCFYLYVKFKVHISRRFFNVRLFS